MIIWVTREFRSLSVTVYFPFLGVYPMIFALIATSWTSWGKVEMNVSYSLLYTQLWNVVQWKCVWKLLLLSIVSFSRSLVLWGNPSSFSLSGLHFSFFLLLFISPVSSSAIAWLVKSPRSLPPSPHSPPTDHLALWESRFIHRLIELAMLLPRLALDHDSCPLKRKELRQFGQNWRVDPNAAPDVRASGLGTGNRTRTVTQIRWLQLHTQCTCYVIPMETAEWMDL